MDLSTIEKEALQLSEEQRAHLADRLICSITKVPDDIKDSWIAESEERMEAFRNDEISSVDGPSAVKELRSKYLK